jgi:hypothetical protein
MKALLLAWDLRGKPPEVFEMLRACIAHSWHTAGWRAKVEQMVFHAPLPVGALPVVTRIWIGNAA